MRLPILSLGLWREATPLELQSAKHCSTSSPSSELAASLLEGTGSQFSQVKAGEWLYPRFKAEPKDGAALNIF